MTKHEGGRYHDGERFLPWYTSPCLEWLMTLDLKGKRVFEFGLGDSTLYYRAKGAISLGVDNDVSWCLKVGDIDKGYECETLEHPYYTSILKYPAFFDIVVNDGAFRDLCTAAALMQLKPGGYLIIDNYKQPSVQADWPLTDELIKGLPITIYKEPSHYDWQTAVITKI